MDACSEQMRSLARAGRQLFQAMFPEDTPLNSLVKELAPGDRLTIHWKDCSPHHVPWPLLFRGSMPRPGQPVQAQDFLGLRLRISHVVQPHDTTRSLKDDAMRAHLMYWGGQPDDETLQTAQEHAAELACWHPHGVAGRGPRTQGAAVGVLMGSGSRIADLCLLSGFHRSGKHTQSAIRQHQ
ncbi:hypothetical protein [Streptomyces sp. NPDC048192]|uniref:hypothetical protein n=1 Tax=Streptomyces sp. NPDC048192 TaxID=3365510 RepID=UPI0037140568